MRTTFLAAWVAFGLGILLVDARCGLADEQPKTTLKTEHFDRDPMWEGRNNRIVPKKPLMVTQDFGYSPTNYAGKRKGK
jgi:hypothetical protein